VPWIGLSSMGNIINPQNPKSLKIKVYGNSWDIFRVVWG